MSHSRPRYYTPIGRGNEDLGAASTCHAVAARAAVGSAAPMSVAVNAADLQLHWQYVRRSRVHGNQRSCTCGMLAAQVLIATADRRVMSRPRVRQSAAPSRHQLLPARGARGACKWRVSAGRRCSDVAHSSPASASSVFDLEPRLRSSVSSTKRDSRARVAGGDGLRATCSCAGRYRSQLAPGARSIPVGMAAASAQIGVCRGRECGSRQPSHAISSSPHVVHVVHAAPWR